MPALSVIIASVNGLPAIDECLTALSKQRGELAAEIVVVDCCRNGTAEHIKKSFPHVRLLQTNERLGIPEMRAMGMAQATGDIIAVIEDHCIVSDNWLEEMLKAHQSQYVAVGGAVENGSVKRITDWAAFLCEYSFVMLPIPNGEVESIAGNNVSYKREALKQVDEVIKRDYWEYFLHEELKKAGGKFLSASSIVVKHRKEFGFFYFLAQRFHYSRSFAGMRRTRIPLQKRIFYLLLSPMLPLLMIGRIARHVFQKKRFRKEFILSLPSLAIFMLSYAAGEFVGYLFGSGHSLLKVE